MSRLEKLWRWNFSTQFIINPTKCLHAIIFWAPTVLTVLFLIYFSPGANKSAHANTNDRATTTTHATTYDQATTCAHATNYAWATTSAHASGCHHFKLSPRKSQTPIYRVYCDWQQTVKFDKLNEMQWIAFPPGLKYIRNKKVRTVGTQDTV